MNATLARELSPWSVSNIAKIAAMALLFVITLLHDRVPTSGFSRWRGG